MSTLRKMIDGASPEASNVGVEKTLKDLHDAKSNYDVEKVKTLMKMAPARQLIQTVDQAHQMGMNDPTRMNQGQFNAPGANPGNDPTTGAPTDNANVGQQGQPMQNAPGVNSKVPQQGQKSVQQPGKGNLGQKPAKKPGFPNANKEGTQAKLKKVEEKKKTSVYGGGPGSGRKPSVNSDYYKRETGKSPRGHATWAFGPQRNTPTDKAFFHNGDYREAKQKAQEWGATQGHHELHVQL